MCWPRAATSLVSAGETSSSPVRLVSGAGAAQVAGNPNLLSAESWNLNGMNAYKITFTNNDVVYIGLDGQVLGVQIAPVVVNVSAPVVQQVKHKNEDNNTSNESHDDHEDEEEDHEDEHDD